MLLSLASELICCPADACCFAAVEYAKFPLLPPYLQPGKEQLT